MRFPPNKETASLQTSKEPVADSGDTCLQIDRHDRTVDWKGIPSRTKLI